MNAVMVDEAVTVETETTCAHCHAELTWRDALYGGTGGLCKRCKRSAERDTLKGRFTPFMRSVLRGGKRESMVVRGNRAMRRHPLTLPGVPNTKAPHTPRASRRAAVRRAKQAEVTV